MNVNSKLWSMRSYNDVYVHVTQIATGAIRTVSRGKVPSVHDISMMSEGAFDALARKLFHGEY